MRSEAGTSTRYPLRPISNVDSDSKKLHDGCPARASSLAVAHALAATITLWNGDSQRSLVTRSESSIASRPVRAKQSQHTLMDNPIDSSETHLSPFRECGARLQISAPTEELTSSVCLEIPLADRIGTNVEQICGGRGQLKVIHLRPSPSPCENRPDGSPSSLGGF